MKPHRFHPEADEEYANAAAHYARVSPELGGRFYDEIERAIAEVCVAPHLCRRAAQTRSGLLAPPSTALTANPHPKPQSQTPSDFTLHRGQLLALRHAQITFTFLPLPTGNSEEPTAIKRSKGE